MDTDAIDLARNFAELNRCLRGDPTFDVTAWVAELAVKAVPGCEMASVTELRHARLITTATTDPVLAGFGAAQQVTGQGPSLEAARGDEVVVTCDLAADQRWPGLARRAGRETAARSVFAVRVLDDPATVLNLVSTWPDAFGAHRQAACFVFGVHAASSVAHAHATRASTHLHVALESSRQIGMAVGILMNAHQLDEGEAFNVLKRASQCLNIKIRDIAERLAQDGQLPRPRDGADRITEANSGSALP